MTFPVLRKFEVEVVSMTLHLQHAPDIHKFACGTMTSGGTESILCAVKTYRDRARYMWPHIRRPEIVRIAIYVLLFAERLCAAFFHTKKKTTSVMGACTRVS